MVVGVNTKKYWLVAKIQVKLKTAFAADEATRAQRSAAEVGRPAGQVLAARAVKRVSCRRQGDGDSPPPGG